MVVIVFKGEKEETAGVAVGVTFEELITLRLGKFLETETLDGAQVTVYAGKDQDALDLEVRKLAEAYGIELEDYGVRGDTAHAGGTIKKGGVH